MFNAKSLFLLFQALCFVAFLSQECAAQTKGIVGQSGSDLPLGANDTIFVWLKTTQRVGIGTSNPQVGLDVATGIKFGYTGLACNSSRYGAVRYNPHVTPQRMELCHPFGWLPVKLCYPASSGGSYVIRSFPFTSSVNPVTGDYSCPAGFTPTVTASGGDPYPCWAGMFYMFCFAPNTTYTCMPPAACPSGYQ